jgi:hypothetical protein
MMMTNKGTAMTTTNDVLAFDDSIPTTMLPPRNDDSVAPELVIPKGYLARMDEEYEQWAKAA